MSLIFVFLGLWNQLLLPESPPLHEFYVGICEVKHNPDLRQLEIRMKTFTNDFEDAVKKHSGESPRFDTSGELSDSYQRIENYYQSKIQVQINGEAIDFAYWNHEYEDDAIWTWLYAEDICEIESLEIRNEVLMEIFDSQTNILRVEVNEEKKFYNLTKDLPYEEIRYD